MCAGSGSSKLSPNMEGNLEYYAGTKVIAPDISVKDVVTCQNINEIAGYYN